MAEIKTRIALKYDSLSNWQSSVFNGADSSKWLKAGEVAIVTLGSDVESTHPTNSSNQHPLLFKVGTGVHKFDDLAWASALAADVYDWAKQPTLRVEDLPTLPLQVVDPDAATKKFITGISYADNKLTITRSNVDWSDVENKPNFVNSIKTTDDDVVVLTPETAATGDVTITGAHAKKGPANGYVGTQAKATINAFGDTMTIKVPKLTVDEYGHTGEASEVEYTISLPTPEAAVNTVTTVEGKDSVKVEDKAADGNHAYEVSLVLDDSGNVALSQSANGLKADIDLSAYQTILNDKDTKYHLEYDSAKTEIKLVVGENDGQMTIDAKPFIKDGMIKHVEVVTEGTASDGTEAPYLKIVWNVDANYDGDNKNEDEIYIPLNMLVDVYTGDATDTITVEVSADRVITASVNNKSIKLAHLADEVTQAIAKDDDTTYTFTASNENYFEFTVQDNNNGTKHDPVTVTLKAGALARKDSLTAADVGAATAGDIEAAISDLDSSVSATAGSVLTGVTITDGKLTNKTEVALHTVATSGSYNDLKDKPTLGALAAKDKIVADDFADEIFVFNCGTASTVI